MFRFNKNKDNKVIKNKYEIIQEWLNSEDYERLIYLQTLIIKTYETVGIKADLLGTRLNNSFTRSDYVEDFRMFFKPVIFDKLKAWCDEYETLRKVEEKIMENL